MQWPHFWFPSNRHFWALSTSTSSGCFGGAEGGLGSLLQIGSPVDSDSHQEWESTLWIGKLTLQR